MLRCMLRAKIHMASVTEANLEYEGSITIDEVILKKAGILPYEQVMISNLNNGERFETYVIPGRKKFRRDMPERAYGKKGRCWRQGNNILLRIL